MDNMESKQKIKKRGGILSLYSESFLELGTPGFLTPRITGAIYFFSEWNIGKRIGKRNKKLY